MALDRLNVTAVRNLQAVALSLSPRINLLTGANGSGKTSLLEAVHLLGLARSFRSTRLQPVIQTGIEECTVFGQTLAANDINAARLGISRNRNGDYQIRIDGENIRSAAELAERMPLQLINPDSFRLLEGSPKVRRQFLDWGVFHVEQQFLPTWRNLQTALRQRNAWLRHGRLDDSSRHAWDRELCTASENIDRYRHDYIRALKPVFEQTLAELISLEDLKLSYYRGWDKDRPLREVLDANLQRDQQLGHTQAGPQRADLRIRIAGYNAADVLSRGQQKLVVCALHIAQGHLLNQVKRAQCLYLIDDLPSELDEQHRNVLCRLLEDLHCQVFITCVDPGLISYHWNDETPIAMFHVEHGRIELTRRLGTQA